MYKRQGQHGAVTIATNMAGRGTDIKLDDEAKAAGGLKLSLIHICIGAPLWGCMPSYGIITFDKEHDVMKLDVDYIEY